MDAHDTVHAGVRCEKVCLFDRIGRQLHIGSPVPPPPAVIRAGASEQYAIAMSTGGFVTVVDGYLALWAETAHAEHVIDVHGAALSPQQVVEHQASSASEHQFCSQCATIRRWS